MGIEELLVKVVDSNNTLAEKIKENSTLMAEHIALLKGAATGAKAPAASTSKKADPKTDKPKAARYTPEAIQALAERFRSEHPSKVTAEVKKAFVEIISPIMGDADSKLADVILAVDKHDAVGDALTAALEGFASAPAVEEDDDF
jgi:hypothetical protein